MYDTDSIQAALRSLGITAQYKGYRQVTMAVQLAMEDEDRLYSVTKAIYWEVADRIHCGRAQIERNLRTISHRAWRVNPSGLREMARYPLTASPTATELIAILVAYLQNPSPTPRA